MYSKKHFIDILPHSRPFTFRKLLALMDERNIGYFLQSSTNSVAQAGTSLIYIFRSKVSENIGIKLSGFLFIYSPVILEFVRFSPTSNLFWGKNWNFLRFNCIFKHRGADIIRKTSKFFVCFTQIKPKEPPSSNVQASK